MKKSLSSTIEPQAYFKIYCFTLFICGSLISSIGPMIPYLSEDMGIPETQFSFLFMARTIGSLIGCFIYKYLRKTLLQNFNEHRIMAVCSAICCFFSYLFVVWRSIFGEWIQITVIGGCYYFIITTCNILLLVISTKNHGWMSFGTGIFGIGALSAPQIVRYFSFKLFYFLSFLFFCQSVLSFYYPTPKKQENTDQKEKNQPKFKEANLTEEILISLGFFLIVGIQVTVSGWLPTYAILTGICDKSQATTYITLFWTVSTIFRFVAAALEVRHSIKLKTLVVTIFSSGLICITLHQMDSYGPAAIFCSIFYGIGCSAVYAMLLSVSSEFGIRFKPQQTANMMLSTVFSYGILVALTGKLMQASIDSFFYSIFAMSIALMLVAFYAIKMMQRQSQNVNQKETQLKEMLGQ